MSFLAFVWLFCKALLFLVGGFVAICILLAIGAYVVTWVHDKFWPTDFSHENTKNRD